MTQRDESAQQAARLRRIALAGFVIVVGMLACIFLLNWYLNRPPAILASAGGPYEIGEAETITLSAEASQGENIATYLWDFGDGNSGEGVTVSHVYDDGPNVYTATLTIANDQGQQAVAQAPVRVNNRPPAANLEEESYSCAPNQTIQLRGNCSDPSNLDNRQLSCNWVGPDGQAIPEGQFVCPGEPGEVEVNLVSTDKDGASIPTVAKVTITEAPADDGSDGDGDGGAESESAQAQSGGSLRAQTNGPYVGTVGDPIIFKADGSEPGDAIRTYRWDFGNGEVREGRHTPYRYPATGDYNVRLIVIGPNEETASATTQAVVTRAPVAVIAVPQPCSSGSAGCFTFNGSGSNDPDGRIVAHTWDFGDGTTASGAVVEHVFPNQQQHRVVLTVTDDKGASASSAVICDSTGTVIDPNTGDRKQ